MFGLASHPAWYILFWCGSVVIVCGFVTRRPPALHGAARGPVQGTQPLPRYMPLQPPSGRATGGFLDAVEEPEPVWVPRFLMNRQPPGDPDPRP